MPCKPYPFLKEGRTYFSTEMPISTPNVTIDLHDIPSDGNAKVKCKEWTDAEKKNIDNYLLTWARCEVDFANRVVRSTKCQRTTENTSAVCDDSEAIKGDPAFKKAVQRVNVSVSCRTWEGAAHSSL